MPSGPTHPSAHPALRASLPAASCRRPPLQHERARHRGNVQRAERTLRCSFLEKLKSAAQPEPAARHPWPHPWLLDSPRASALTAHAAAAPLCAATATGATQHLIITKLPQWLGHLPCLPSIPAENCSLLVLPPWSNPWLLAAIAMSGEAAGCGGLVFCSADNDSPTHAPPLQAAEQRRSRVLSCCSARSAFPASLTSPLPPRSGPAPADPVRPPSGRDVQRGGTHVSAAAACAFYPAAQCARLPCAALPARPAPRRASPLTAPRPLRLQLGGVAHGAAAVGARGVGGRAAQVGQQAVRPRR